MKGSQIGGLCVRAPPSKISEADRFPDIILPLLRSFSASVRVLQQAPPQHSSTSSPWASLPIFKFMNGRFEKWKGDDAYLLQLG